MGCLERIFGSSSQQLYAFYSKTASAMTDATIALNRSFAESYDGSKDIMAAEKSAMNSARIVFGDKFADPESL